MFSKSHIQVSNNSLLWSIDKLHILYMYSVAAKKQNLDPGFGPNIVIWQVDTRGGFSHWHGIRICACLLGHLFAKFGIAIGGFSSETKEPKLHKLGVFWANYCKKHPIWSKLGAFLPKMVYWWVGNLAKNWYRDSQIFEVRQAHPRTILVKEPPPGVDRYVHD